jgi:secondary thiamine-phosphate synthase enzyme
MINTENEKEIVNITNKVRQEIKKYGIKEGMVLVNSMHITSSIFINDEESGLKNDFIKWLEEIAPEGDYEHHQTGETNADAHLKRTIMGREVVVASSLTAFCKSFANSYLIPTFIHQLF